MDRRGVCDIGKVLAEALARQLALQPDRIDIEFVNILRTFQDLGKECETFEVNVLQTTLECLTFPPGDDHQLVSRARLVCALLFLFTYGEISYFCATSIMNFYSTNQNKLSTFAKPVYPRVPGRFGGLCC